MSSYSEIARERKRARSMFLELRARDFELLAQESPEDLTGYVISLVGPAYDDELLQRIKANKPGLLKILLNRWDPDLEAIQQEGAS
jgi:hypothetical protein